MHSLRKNVIWKKYINLPELLAEYDVDDKVDGGIDDGEEIDRLTRESVECGVVLQKM